MNKHIGKTVAKDGTCNYLDNACNRMPNTKIRTLIILFWTGGGRTKICLLKDSYYSPDSTVCESDSDIYRRSEVT
jgi:hypothetical protein